MSDTNSSAEREPIERLAEEFVARYRNGEHPPLSEYIERHPELAEQVKELFPALVLMEQFKPGDKTGSFNGEPLGPEGLPLEKLGDFRILREIGRGGMGVVYEAEQISLGRHVALKILTSRARLEPRQLARFEREAKAAARLHHTNIVPVYGVGSDAGLHYYVMQYIAGMGLDLVLAEMRKLPAKATPSVENVARSLSSDKSLSAAGHPESAESSARSDTSLVHWHSVARIGVQVAEALHHAQQQGIWHRDIKPSNLLLDEQGTVWVTDFGLAKAQDSEDLTHTGDLVGTLRYMAPERFNGQGDVRSDLYSLGLTLYELIALRPAFDAEDRNQLLRQVMDAEPPRLRKLVPNLPRDLETIVHKAMAREPIDRYASGQEMAADLRRFLEDRPILARRISTLERFGRWCRRNPVIASLTSSVAAALLVVAALSVGLAWNIAAKSDVESKKRLEAEQAQRDAEAAADQQALLIGQQYTANGVRLLDAGDYGGAALWFAEALEQDGKHAERAAIHKTRLTNTLRACPLPHHVWFHEDTVRDAAYSPNGKLVAVLAGKDLHLWDVITGQPTCNPLGHEHDLRLFAYSETGSRLVTVTVRVFDDREGKALEGYVVRVWDANTGKPLTPSLLHAVQGNARVTDLLSADGERLIVCPNAHSFQVWNVTAGKPLGPTVALPNEGDNLNRVVLRADGRQVITLAFKEEPDRRGPNRFTLWDVEQGKPVAAPRLIDEFSEAAYSSDGKQVQIVSSDTVESCDASTGKTVWTRKLAGYSGGEFTPDGSRFLMLAKPTAQIEELLLDGKTGQPIPTPPQPDFTGEVAAISPNNRFALLLDGEHTARVWNLTNLTPVGFPFRHDSQFVMGCFSPDGQRVLLIGSDHSARVWDVQNGLPLTPLLKHAEPIEKASFRSDGSQILIVSGNTARTWPLDPPPQARVLEAKEGQQARRSPDGRRVLVVPTNAFGDGMGEPVLHDVATGVPVPLVEPERLRSSHILYAFSPDGRLLLGSTSSEACVWDAATGARKALIQKQKLSVSCFTPDGGTLVLVNEMDQIRLFDALSGAARTPWRDVPARVDKQKLELKYLMLVFSADGRRYFRPNAADIIDAETGRIVTTLDARARDPRQGTLIEFSPDGRLVVDAVSNGTFQVWDAETGKAVTPVLSLTGNVKIDEQGTQPCAFSPDSKRLMGYGFGVARVWDITTGKPLTPPLRHERDLTKVLFSPDSGRLLTATEDGKVFVWDAGTGELLAAPLRHADRLAYADFSKDGRFILTMTNYFGADVPPPGKLLSLGYAETCVWEVETGQPLTPPLRCRLPSFSAYPTPPYDGEGRTAVRWRHGGLEVCDLTADERSLADLRELAQLVSGRRINTRGSMVSLDAERFADAWRSQSERPWAKSARTIADPIVWHRGEAATAFLSFHYKSTADERRRNAEAAEWHLTQLLKRAPKDNSALQRRVQLYVETGRWKEALIDYTTLTEIDDGWWYERGHVNAQLGNWKEAEDAFRRLPQWHFQRWEAMNYAALLKARRSDWDAWRALCQELISGDEVRMMSGRPIWRVVFTAGPDAVKDWNFANQEVKETLEHLAKEDGSPSYQSAIAAVLLRMGGREEEMLRLLPPDQMPGVEISEAAGWFLRAIALHRLKRPDKAAEALAKGREALKSEKSKERSAVAEGSIEDWQERVYAELLEREATKLIEGK